MSKHVSMEMCEHDVSEGDEGGKVKIKECEVIVSESGGV